MPRKVTRELKAVGGNFEPGAYKFKVVKVTDNAEKSSWTLDIKTWMEDNTEGPEIKAFVQYDNYEKDWHEDESNRICQVMCGRLDVDMPDFQDKTGYVVLGYKGRYLRPMTGGFYTMDRKDAFGEENMSDCIALAMATEKTNPTPAQDVQDNAGSAI